MSKMDVVIATDCGSTTTKAILIERREDGYHQTFRGEAPTTVEAPFEDVTRGVLNAIQEVEELNFLLKSGIVLCKLITKIYPNSSIDIDKLEASYTQRTISSSCTTFRLETSTPRRRTYLSSCWQPEPMV